MSDQKRFDELKEKGYKNLDMDTRKEYSELKDKLEPSKGVLSMFKKSKVGEDNAPEKKTEAQKLEVPKELEIKATELIKQSGDEDRITRLERMVSSLTNENSSLRKETAKMEKGWAEYESPKDRNSTATLKIYREDADAPACAITKITTFKNNAFNEETRKRDKLIYTVSTMDKDGNVKDLKMDAVDFAAMKEIEEVEIISEDSRVLKKVDGHVSSPELDRDKFPKRMLDGGSGYGTNVGGGKVPLEVFKVESTVTVKRENGQEIQMEAKYLNM